jgi:hypothetical protein
VSRLSDRSFCGAKDLTKQDGEISDLPAKCIPHSVVHLAVPEITKSFFADLLASRQTRDLQSLEIAWVSEKEAAALIAELVCTDRSKQWTLQAKFAQDTGAAFCVAAITAQTVNQFSSLTAITAYTTSADMFMFAALLLVQKQLTSYIVRDSIVCALCSEIEPCPALLTRAASQSDEATDFDRSSWSKMLGAALLRTNSLHTFSHDDCDLEIVTDAVQHNHHIIRCLAPAYYTECGSLLLNRV